MDLHLLLCGGVFVVDCSVGALVDLVGRREAGLVGRFGEGEELGVGGEGHAEDLGGVVLDQGEGGGGGRRLLGDEVAVVGRGGRLGVGGHSVGWKYYLNEEIVQKYH